MQKRNLFITLLVILVASFSVKAHAMILGRLASAPVQPFNKQIRLANQQQQAWVHDYRQIALRFANAGDALSRINTRQLDNQLVLTLTLENQQDHRDTVYIMSLVRHNNLWQLRQAQIGWRCQGDSSFNSVPCPN